MRDKSSRMTYHVLFGLVCFVMVVVVMIVVFVFAAEEGKEGNQTGKAEAGNQSDDP
jgi:uncharacterized membrane protein